MEWCPHRAPLTAPSNTIRVWRQCVGVIECPDVCSHHHGLMRTGTRTDGWGKEGSGVLKAAHWLHWWVDEEPIDQGTWNCDFWHGIACRLITLKQWHQRKQSLLPFYSQGHKFVFKTVKGEPIGPKSSDAFGDFVIRIIFNGGPGIPDSGQIRVTTNKGHHCGFY